MSENLDAPRLNSTKPTGSPYFGELVEASHTTSQGEMENIIENLRRHKDAWVRLEIKERLSILDEIRRDLINIQESWIAAELEGQGNDPNSLGEAEEWILLAAFYRAIRRIRQSLVEIGEFGQPRIRGELQTRPGGQVVAGVYPETIADRLLFRGVTGEVWMEPGITIEEFTTTLAAAYKDPNRSGKVALVLGAGNATMTAAIDALHKLFVELQVVVLKPNPVNAYMGPLMEQAFRGLIERGYLGIVYGGASEGSYLCNHPEVDELHITGSDKTYEAIVFGPGPEGARRKAAREPLNTKRFSGELGNISPVIVVPGPWSKNDIKEQANQIASWFVANAGFACLTPRVIVQHASWNQRSELLAEIGRSLDNTKTRKAYYPGAEERITEFVNAHPEAHQYGTPQDDHLPWTFITDVDPDHKDDICFKQESFCSLYAETAIEAPSVVEFIERAVDFANDTLWGTLSAILIVHPESYKDPNVAAAIEKAIYDLRYGTVSINMLAYYSAYLMVTPWGAFPGHDIYDIQSGIGKVFNFLMIEGSQKSVLRAPFKRLDPITIKSKRAPEFAKQLAEFDAEPALWKLPGLAWTALRS
ncbi:MAG: aldehyde dehydrogenase [Anaerolineales bacterium]|nr:aldehyde dehydrogenase [Anaerolineales bacterium]